MQRPDYMRAELMVEKAGLDVRVAKKELLPTINISGFALFNAGDLGSILTTKNALMGLAGGAILPLFTGGRRLANIRLKKQLMKEFCKTTTKQI